MLKTKRLPLSLRISEHAAHTLKQRTEREGHRYPAVLAASLLERALAAPAAQHAPDEPEAVVMLRGFARAMSATLEVKPEGLTVIMPVGVSMGGIEWIRAMFAKCPVLAGSKVTVLGGLPS